MIYRIEYSYLTGDSNETYHETRLLEGSWRDLYVAKANLHRIAEHYRYYQDWVDDKSKLAKIKKADWFVEGYDRRVLRLFTDDGTSYQISPPWCGFFEHLYSARIIVEFLDKSGIEITFPRL